MSKISVLLIGPKSDLLNEIFKKLNKSEYTIFQLVANYKPGSRIRLKGAIGIKDEGLLQNKFDYTIFVNTESALSEKLEVFSSNQNMWLENNSNMLGKLVVVLPQFALKSNVDHYYNLVSALSKRKNLSIYFAPIVVGTASNANNLRTIISSVIKSHKSSSLSITDTTSLASFVVSKMHSFSAGRVKIIGKKYDKRTLLDWSSPAKNPVLLEEVSSGVEVSQVLPDTNSRQISKLFEMKHTTRSINVLKPLFAIFSFAFILLFPHFLNYFLKVLTNYQNSKISQVKISIFQQKAAAFVLGIDNAYSQLPIIGDFYKPLLADSSTISSIVAVKNKSQQVTRDINNLLITGLGQSGENFLGELRNLGINMSDLADDLKLLSTLGDENINTYLTNSSLKLSQAGSVLKYYSEVARMLSNKLTSDYSIAVILADKLDLIQGDKIQEYVYVVVGPEGLQEYTFVQNSENAVRVKSLQEVFENRKFFEDNKEPDAIVLLDHSALNELLEMFGPFEHSGAKFDSNNINSSILNLRGNNTNKLITKSDLNPFLEQLLRNISENPLDENKLLKIADLITRKRIVLISKDDSIVVGEPVYLEGFGEFDCTFECLKVVAGNDFSSNPSKYILSSKSNIDLTIREAGIELTQSIKIDDMETSYMSNDHSLRGVIIFIAPINWNTGPIKVITQDKVTLIEPEISNLKNVTIISLPANLLTPNSVAEVRSFANFSDYVSNNSRIQLLINKQSAMGETSVQVGIKLPSQTNLGIRTLVPQYASIPPTELNSLTSGGKFLYNGQVESDIGFEITWQ